MAISITDPDLERRLERLGQRQPVPCTKRAMAIAILREAVKDDRGRPVHKWKQRARKFRGRLGDDDTNDSGSGGRSS